MAHSVMEPALDKCSMGCLKHGCASIKTWARCWRKLCTQKCRFNHIYCNPRPKTATYISRDNKTVSRSKMEKIQQKP